MPVRILFVSNVQKYSHVAVNIFVLAYSCICHIHIISMNVFHIYQDLYKYFALYPENIQQYFSSTPNSILNQSTFDYTATARVQNAFF